MRRFNEALFPGFSGIGLIKGRSCASVGVWPGWQAAKASLANDVVPLLTRASTSFVERATSKALLLRAFTDSSEVPIMDTLNGSAKVKLWCL